MRLLKKNRRQLLALLSLLLILSFGGTPYVRALEISVTGNGSESVNEVAVQTSTITSVQQSNEANVSNNVATDANTGGNTASGNTGGSTAIDTGNITENVSVETAANASSVETPCCAQESSAEISGNGADSQNSINVSQTSQTNVTLEQTANVTNKVEGKANTGENTANDNNGNVSIATGDIRVSGGIENGPINVYNVSAPAGGDGFSIKISDNGAGSQNNISLNIFDPTNVFINSYADIENFVNWDLNTGGNVANGNNGDVTIRTGDIFFDFFIKNGPINVGGVWIPCCLPPVPPPPPPPPPGNGGGPGDGGFPPTDGGKPSDGQPSPTGAISEAAASTEAGGPWVVGLSDTSSPQARALLFLVGLAMIAYGVKIVGKEAKERFL